MPQFELGVTMAVAIGIPEHVPVVPGSGEALGRDRPLLGPRAGLEHVEHGEADRLLHLGVAVQLDVGTIPERVQVGRCAATRPSQPSNRAPSIAAAT
jgi:hypothetical protein